MEFTHIPVLFRETIDSLRIDPEGTYIDGTAGGGGHSAAILSRLTTGTLLAIDRDPDAVETVTARFRDCPNAVVVRGNYAQMDELAAAQGITAADGILLDVGVSSHQLDEPGRGFSYRNDAPLDMRMSQEGPTAADLVNTLPQRELAQLIFRYGEDKNANRIAAGIVGARERGPIETTGHLAELVKASVPAAVRRAEGHPARRTFQALRIAVNGELDALDRGMDAAFGLLKPGGRLAVISFHSLEDRIVKQKMAGWCTGCICPKDFPVCVCGRKPQGRLVEKKGVTPSPEELQENPRSRSARLRVIEKI